MTTIGKLWTAGIAYVALAVGAGLSIMYNVVDTMAVRGPALDVYDIVTAVAAPAIVVLMVELFVSNWWVDAEWPMQTLRWLGCLVIGGVAMRASWTHGHDFMSRRGQAADVAISWPLAIDLLAVMATALILLGRRARMSADSVATVKLDLSTVPADANGMDPTVMDRIANLPDTTVTVTFDSDRDRWVDIIKADTDMPGPLRDASDVPLSEDEIADMSAGMQGLADANARDRWANLASPDVDTPVTTDHLLGDRAPDVANLNGMATWAQWSYGDDRAVHDLLAEAATAAAPLPRRTRTAGQSYPAEMAEYVQAWDPTALSRSDLVLLLAGWFEVSDRTARRWLAAYGGRPTSGPPYA